MPNVSFTPSLRRHLDAPAMTVDGDTVAAVFEQVFSALPELRSYLLDDQGRLRRHVAVFIDGRRMKDTQTLSDAVSSDSEVCVVQALSGG